MYENLEEIYLSLNNIFKTCVTHSKDLQAEAKLYRNKEILINELENIILKYDTIIQGLKNEI